MAPAPDAVPDAGGASMDDALDALQQLQRHVATATALLAARHGASPVHLRALLVLAAHGPVTATRLGTLVGLSSGAVTPLVDKLEHSGHAARVPAARDRRSVVVSPTDAGLRVVADLRSAYAPVFRRAFGHDLDSAAHVLSSLAGALEDEVATW